MNRLIGLLSLLLSRLPLPVLHGMGHCLGSIAWFIPNRLKRIALRHLELCLPELPEADRRRIARRSLLHFGKALMEAPAIWFGDRARLQGWIDDQQARHKLQQAIGDGPAIVMCPHIGSWELAGMFCAAMGPITLLYKPQRDPLDQLVQKGRSRLGATLVPTNGGGVRAMLRALRDGHMVGILPDQDPPRGAGVFAPLFGIPAHTSELVSKLAARTGVPVCFCYAERLPRGAGFRFHVVKLPTEAVSDPVAGVEALNRGIESVLTHLPEQYWWSYKRFRRLPAGIRSPYASL